MKRFVLLYKTHESCILCLFTNPHQAKGWKMRPHSHHQVQRVGVIVNVTLEKPDGLPVKNCDSAETPLRKLRFRRNACRENCDSAETPAARTANCNSTRMVSQSTLSQQTGDTLPSCKYLMTEMTEHSSIQLQPYFHLVLTKIYFSKFATYNV